MAAGVSKNEVRRKILVLIPQSIDDPASQRGPTGHCGNATVEIADRNLVPVMAGMHRTDDTNIVDDPRGVRQKFGDFRTALSMCREFPGAAEQLFAGPINEAECDLAAIILAMMFRQFRFGVKQVHVGRSAMHEHGNHGGRLRGRRRRPPHHIVCLKFLRLSGWSGQQPLVTKQ